MNCRRLIPLLLCLTGCFSAKPPGGPARDAELDRLTHMARIAFDQGQLQQATRIYQNALQRARALDDATEIGNAAYNVAVCQAADRDYQQARESLLEAERELTRGQGNNLAEVLLFQAKVARWQEQPEEAAALAEKVLSHPASTPSDSDRAQVALLQGNLACDQADTARATAALAEAEASLESVTDPAPHAGLARLAGQIHLREQQPKAAAKAFDREAVLWQQAHGFREMTRALARAGHAWSTAGEPGLGAERYFRAARSRHAQGNHAESMPWIRRASTLAKQAEDGPLQQQISALQREMEQPSGKER